MADHIVPLVSDLGLLAPKASPTFTGAVTVPSPPVNATDAAPKSYVDAVNTLVTEVEADLGEVATSLGLLAPLASPTFTGAVTAAALTVSGLSTATGGLVVGAIGGPVSGLISSADGHLLLQGTVAHQVIFNYSAGTGGVHFFNGAYGEVGGIDSAGKGTFNGGLIATVPGFVASDKYLVMDSGGNIHKSALGPAS